MFDTFKISDLFNKNKNNYFFILFFSFLFFYSLIFVIGIYLDQIPNYCIEDECRYIENVHLLLKGTYQNPLTERLVPPMHSIYIGPIVLLDLGRRFVVYLNLAKELISRAQESYSKEQEEILKKILKKLS